MEQEQSPDKVSCSTVAGVGCVTAIGGFFGGGMTAVLIGKIVGGIRGCAPPEGLPACDWHVYALSGCVIGVILLPAISIIRLKGRRS